MYKNIVFDIYGTLIDIHTNEYEISTWQKLADTLAFYDVNYTAEELKEAYFMSCDLQMKAGEKEHTHPEVDIVEVFRHLFENKNKKTSKILATHLAQEFRAFSTERLRLYNGVTETLTKLKKAKKKLYIVSNAQRCFTRPELVKLGIARYFDGIIYSSDYKCAKPSAELFKVLFEKYKLDKNETIYIGNDPQADVDGAKNAKIDCIWIRTNLTDPDAKPRFAPKYTISDGNFAEISSILLK